MLSLRGDAQHNQVRLSSSVALPLNVGPGNASINNIVPINVPDNELWQITFGGLRITVSNGDELITPVGNALWIVPSNITPFAAGGSGGAPTPLPISVLNNWPSAQIFVSLSLQGVELQKGDQINLSFGVQNGTAAQIQITQILGSIRYRPMRLTSEIAVANLDQGRADALLDARLRASRG